MTSSRWWNTRARGHDWIVELCTTASPANEGKRSMTHAIVMCDAEGIVTHWSDEAERFFGHERGEVIGKPVAVIVPDDFRDAHHAGLERAMSGGERHLEGAATHLPVRHADGAIVCHPARFNHIETAEGDLVAAVAVFGAATPDQEPWAPINVDDD